MPEKTSRDQSAAALRKRAMKRLLANPHRDGADLTSPEPLRLHHELQVHQIELEMQNEELRRSQLELEAARARYFDLYDLAPVGYLTLNAEGVITEANLTAATLLGVARTVLVNTPFPRYIFPEDQDSYYHFRRKFTEPGESRMVELRLRRPDDSVCFMQLQINSVHLGEYRVTSSDSSEHRRIEDELNREKRVLQALGDSRWAALLANNEATYLDEVCRIVVEDCGFQMVWIGYAEEDAARTVRPIAQAGLGQDYLESVRITWDDSEWGQGPTGTAIRTGRMASCRNMLTDPKFTPWRAQAIRRGYASSLVLPLLAAGRAFGALTIYSPKPEGFSAGEIALLTDLAEDLAYGILSLREKKARAEAEAALRRNEAQLQSILNNLTEGLVVADLNGDLIYWNPAAVAMYGFNDATEGQRSLKDLVDTFELTTDSGEVVPVTEWPLARILRGENLHGFELRVRRLDQVWQRAFSYSGTLTQDHQGKPVLGILIISDVTARKDFEEALIQAKQEWERTFDAVPDLISILDKDHRVVRANRATSARLGLTPEEFVGTKCFACVHGKSAPPTACPHAQTMLDGREHVAELHEERLGGDFLVTTTPLYDTAGEMIGSVHVARDITERKKAEARIHDLNSELIVGVNKLEELNKELERSNGDLQQFAYIASHDLQAPLHTVTSFLQLLERRNREQFDEKSHSYINYAVEGTLYMQRLLVDMLAFSKVGGGELKLRPLNLAELAARVVKNLQKTIADHQGEVVIDTALPVIVADETQMLHLLQNLIGNGLKFHGPEAPRVEVFAVKRAGETQICIRDNGIGIDPRFSERIFLIFQRLHNRDEYGGTGIGLAICKKIAERHGGRIWVESQPDQGATFCFSLPEGRDD